MEGLKLDQAQLERLVELDRKFSGDGLTFDDVLLVPAESRVLPNDVSTAAGAQDRDSARLRGDGHSDRGGLANALSCARSTMV
jgi:hypothetical protein